jgi:hypothetical protein
MITEKTPVSKVGCCPPLHPWQSCDELDVRYRIPFRPVVQTKDGEQQLLVEVTVCFRLECCSGPLILGDLLYSTTLLPGEKVRLLTSDRNSRFSFSSDSEYAARQFTTSEQSFFLSGMADSMSNLDVLRQGESQSLYQASAASGGHYAGVDLGFLDIGGYAAATSYDASAASAFFNSLSEHAESSSRKVETSVRASTSTSVAEVASRTHAAGESEDKYESASREFSNQNRCHALTYLFYRIEKCQKLRFKLVAIERRVDDPACPTGIHPLSAGSSAGADQTANGGNGPAPQPIPAAVRAAGLAQVDADLRAEGLLDAAGNCSAETVERLSWERTVRLPTPGVMVKCCLDECDSCEPARKREIELELAAKELNNRLLQRKVELLEQSQEYRCCPGGRCCDHGDGADDGDGDGSEGGYAA